MSNSSPGGSISSIQVPTTISLMSEHVKCLPRHPVFPAEIQEMIRRLVRDEWSSCKSQDDLVHLWTCVRPVKEFQATIEEIFKTQHLPKTVLHYITDPYYVYEDTFSRSRAALYAEWERTPLDHVEPHVFKVQFRFAELREAEPGRAVFKLQHRSDDPNDPENRYEGAIFRHMRERGGLGPMGEGDKYKPSEMGRLFGESERWGPQSFSAPIFEPVATEGMFVVQVRSGLNDCAIPGLKIDQEKREISFNWIGLLDRMFSERKALQEKDLGIDGGLKYPWPPAKQRPRYDVDLPFHGGCMPGDLDPALIDLATRDYRELSELSDEIKTSDQLIERLREPVLTWRNSMGRFVGEERLSIGSLRLKRNCDREVTLNDEGEIDKSRANVETLRMREKISGWKGARRVGATPVYDRCCRGNPASQQLTCDACRFWNQRCMKWWSFDRQEYVSGCEFCSKTNNCCTYRLAKLNNKWLSPSLTSRLLADPVLLPQATGGLTPPNTMRSTQGYGMVGQQHEPNSVPTAEHSLSSIADLVPRNSEIVALNGVGDPSRPYGNLPHKPPNTAANPRRCLSRPALPVIIAPITEESLGAENNSGEDPEAESPASVAEAIPFIPTDDAKNLVLTIAQSRKKDTMRQVMESRGLGNFVVSMERLKKRSDSGPAPNRRESRSVDERDHGPNPQGSQIASTQGVHTADSRKWWGQGQEQDQCENSHDFQLLYFRCITQMNAIIQRRHQGTKYRGKQPSSTQINSCINVALENLALEPSHSTHRMRGVLSSHAANLQVIPTPTENLNGSSIIFKDSSYLPWTRRKALLPNLSSRLDPQSDSFTIEARCPLLKDRDGGVIVPLTNIDRYQPCSYDILHLQQQNLITLSSLPKRPDLLDLQYATLPSITVPGHEMPPRSALGSTPQSTGQVARDVILMQSGKVYIDHLNSESMQQSNTVPSTYNTITLEPSVAQILRTVLPALVLDPTALNIRFTKAEARKMIAWAQDKISSFDSKFTTITIAGQALVIQDIAARFDTRSLSVAPSVLGLPHATRSQDQCITTNGLSFAIQSCSDKFLLHLISSATFGSGSREQDGLYVLLASFDGFSNQVQMTRRLRPRNANCNHNAPNKPPVRSISYRSFASTPQPPTILNRDPRASYMTGFAAVTRWIREHNTNDEGKNYNKKIHPHMTYKSVLVPSKTGNTRRRRDDASVITEVEACKQCVLGTEIQSTQRPQLSQASNDLEGIHRQSYFILPSGEHIPQVLLFNLATRPRFDDYLLPPPTSFDGHHTSDYRNQEVSLKPGTGSFASCESAARDTAKSATCNGEILVLEGFKNSTNTAFNVCKGHSISPRGFSVQSPVHPSYHFPIQNVLSRKRETSREPETPERNYTVLKDLGRTLSRDDSITAETWQQKTIAEEEGEEEEKEPPFHLPRALNSTAKEPTTANPTCVMAPEPNAHTSQKVASQTAQSDRKRSSTTETPVLPATITPSHPRRPPHGLPHPEPRVQHQRRKISTL